MVEKHILFKYYANIIGYKDDKAKQLEVIMSIIIPWSVNQIRLSLEILVDGFPFVYLISLQAYTDNVKVLYIFLLFTNVAHLTSNYPD